MSRRVLLCLALLASVGNLSRELSAQTSTPEQPRNPKAISPAASQPATDFTRVNTSLLDPYPLRMRFHDYLDSIAGRLALGSSAALGAWDYVQNDKPEWGRGAGGYTRYFADELGGRAVGNTLELGVGAATHEDPRYRPLKYGTLRQRAQHAAVRVFLATLPSGKSTAAFCRFAAAYGSAWIGEGWQPARERTAGNVIWWGTLSLAGDIGTNLWREFHGEIGRLAHRPLVVVSKQ